MKSSKTLSLVMAAAMFLMIMIQTNAQTLQLGIAASSEVIGPDDYSTISVIVSNTGATAAQNVDVAINLPNHINDFRDTELPGFDCPGGDCNANEVATWNIGSLASGESQAIFFKIQAASTVPTPALNVSAVASATNASSAWSSLALTIDPTPLVRVTLSSKGSHQPRQEIIYKIQLGNIGSISPPNAILTMPVPAGASFSWASNGGTMNSGNVTWSIGQLGVGEGRLIDVAFMVSNTLVGGDLIKATIELDPALPGEEISRSSVVGAVASNPPLHLDYGISQTGMGAEEEVTYSLTATNSGSTSLSNVEGLIMLPAFIEDFRDAELTLLDCPGGDCNANEVVNWSIGTLAAGQSATVHFRSFVKANTQVGEILRSTARLAASNTGHVTATQSVQVDPSPLLRLGVAGETGFVMPGQSLAYTLTFGNVGQTSVSNAVLDMPVPKGTIFDSASHGGTVNNGVVSWTVPSLAPGKGDRFHVYVTPNASLGQGEVIMAHADIDPTTPSEYLIRSGCVLPVSSNPPLRMHYDATPVAATAGNAVLYQITATNTGPAGLQDVEALVLLPAFIDDFADVPLLDFDCPGGDCNANEIAVWSVGTLAPNQSKSIAFSSTVFPNAQPGNILKSKAAATTSTTGVTEALASVDVLVGSLLSIDLAEKKLLEGFRIGNYPNPVNGKATFTMTIPSSAIVSLRILNSTGQEVARVMKENLAAGKYHFDWNAEGLAGGLYFYHLESGRFRKTGKLIIE